MTDGQIDSVMKSLFEFYMAETPPPTNVMVYKDSIAKLEEDEGYYKATVKIVTNFGCTKAHRLHLKFKINKRGKVYTETVEPEY